MADLVYLQDNTWETLDEEEDTEGASTIHTAQPNSPQQMQLDQPQFREKFLNMRRHGEESDPEMASDEDEDFQLLQPVEKLTKYVESDEIMIRMAVGRLMLSTLRSVADSPGDVARVMELFCVTAADEEDAVRTEMIKQIPDIVRLCHEDTERLHFVIKDHLLPLVKKYLSDSESQVRKVAQAALWALMEGGFIDQDIIEEQVCPFILQMTYHDTGNEMNTNTITLMNKVSAHITKEATERIFLPRFAELCSDPEFYVRRMCAENFGGFCAVIKQETIENFLLPYFFKLCLDEIWGIRRVCAEVFLSVACCVSLSTRQELLTPLLDQLLSDVSQWVKVSAFQTLGPFIATFADPNTMPLDESGYLVLYTSNGDEFKIHRSFMERDHDLTKSESEMHDVSENIESESDVLESDIEGDDISLLFNESESIRVARRSRISYYEQLKPLNLDFQAPTISRRRDRLAFDVETPAEQVQETPTTTVKVERRSEGGLNVHVDTGPSPENFNTFQFWRTPIPDLEIDFSLAGGDPSSPHPAAVHVKATVIDPVSQMTCVSQLNVSVELRPDDEIEKENQAPQVTASHHVVIDERDYSLGATGSDGLNSTFCKDESSIIHNIPSQPPRLEEAHKQKIVPPILIEYFVWMADQQHMTEDDMPLFCASSLPAVALTLTRNHWDCLAAAYSKLATNIQWKVRRIMASCIYKVAEILGQRITCNSLIPIFKNMIQDVDVVRISCLKHLYDFLKLLSLRARLPFLPLLEDFLQMDNELNWRLREEFALQLYLSVSLFPGQFARKYIAPLTMRLLFDQVAAVRQMAILLATQLIHQISNDASILRDLLALFAEELAHSIRWSRRQTFVLLCSKILTEQTLSDEDFGRELLPHLADLCWDKVPNVRLSLARTITTDLMPNEYFSGQNSPHAKQLISALKKLSKDKDSDVRHFATYDLESLTSTSTELTSNLFTNSTFMQMTDNSDPEEMDS